MEIKNIDKSNMRKTILDFPKQFKIGINAAKKVRFKEWSFLTPPENIIVCGMGGSALVGDIMQIFLQDKKIDLPLHISRGYKLPHWVDKKDLVVCTSYSGNTEETLSSFAEARKRKLPLIVITSGGGLAELCQKNNIPFSKIPTGYQPRMTLGLQFATLIEILINCKIVKELENIGSLEKKLKPESLEDNGRKIAKKLKNKIPLIYASDRFKSLAKIWKIKFNENSKVPAFFNYFPELNHNEMVGYTNASKTMKDFQVIILRDRADGKKINERMNLTASILKNKGVGVDLIEIKGRSILEKIFSNLILSDWVSYYLAISQKIDPTPVGIIENFKKKLKKK